jgi:hypothetical protein
MAACNTAGDHQLGMAKKSGMSEKGAVSVYGIDRLPVRIDYLAFHWSSFKRTNRHVQGC